MINVDNEPIYTIERFDTVQSKSRGYNGIVASVQDFAYGRVYEVISTDDLGTAPLIRSKLVLVSKYVNTGSIPRITE